MNKLDSKIPSVNLSRQWLFALKNTRKSFGSGSKTGKWCIFLDESVVDSAWKKITEGTENGNLGEAAKVSTKLQSISYDNVYLICVYTQDFNDKVEILRVRESLRDLGFIDPIKYKRDIDTRNGIDQYIYTV